MYLRAQCAKIYPLHVYCLLCMSTTYNAIWDGTTNMSGSFNRNWFHQLPNALGMIDAFSVHIKWPLRRAQQFSCEEIEDSTFWILMLLSIIKVISSLLPVAIFCTITKHGVQKTTSHTTQNMCLLLDGGYPAIYPLLTRLLPNGSPGARGSYYLPSGDQNFKQGAWTGALNLWLSD